jgi:hypothetical protein
VTYFGGFAIIGVATLDFGFPTSSNDIARLICPKCGALCRRREEYRRDIRRRFFYFVSSGETWPMWSKSVVMWRRRHHRRRDARRQFPRVVFSDILRLTCSNYGIFLCRLDN